MAKSTASQEKMTQEEAKSYRASLYKPTIKPLTEKQKREAFRVFWVSNKKKYGITKPIEKALWLHLQATKNDLPEKFHDGLANFGLKKIK